MSTKNIPSSDNAEVFPDLTRLRVMIADFDDAIRGKQSSKNKLRQEWGRIKIVRTLADTEVKNFLQAK